MPLSDIVDVSITAATRGVTRESFGIPLILGYHTKFGELVRSYSSLAGMIADGFSLNSPEYLAAAAMQAQSVAPDHWLVGRRTNAPTTIVNLTPAATNNAIYTVTIQGEAHVYTADTATTVKEIVEGLKALIAANTSLSGVVTATEDDTKLILTGASGVFFTWAVTDDTGNANGMGRWTVKDVSVDDHANNDIAAIAAADSTWYSFVTTHQNAANGALLASWAESNHKLFLIDLADSDIKGSGSSDLASVVETAGDVYTAVSYHQDMSQFMSAAWLGKCLPDDPGTNTWKFKTLSTISADILTDSEIGYISGKHANWYQEIAGVNITQEGWTGGNEFIDVTIFVDWLKANLAADVFGILVNNKKVPYTEGGIALVESAVRGRLDIATGTEARPGGLAKDPAYTVTVPAVSDVSSSDRALRLLPDIYFTGTLSGAIHSIEISGVISV